MTVLLIANLLLASCMTGLIWFVQIVHYPLLGAVGASSAVAYEQSHVTRTGWVVAPIMLGEAAIAVILPQMVEARMQFAAWASVVILVVIWLSTALLQVPCHRLLSLQFSPQVVRRLVRTNWIRTGCWTGRSVLGCVMLLTLEP